MSLFSKKNREEVTVTSIEEVTLLVTGCVVLSTRDSWGTSFKKRICFEDGDYMDVCEDEDFFYVERFDLLQMRQTVYSNGSKGWGLVANLTELAEIEKAKKIRGIE